MEGPFVSAGASVGATPGLEHDDIVKLPDGPAPVCVTCIDYGPGHAQQQLVEDLEDFLAHHRPERSVVRWINVDGLSNVRVIHALTPRTSCTHWRPRPCSKT